MSRVAVVTGAAGGIGAATCSLLAERGWDVVGIVRRDPPADQPRWRTADCAQPAELEAALADLDRIDGLVNNAALQHGRPLLETSVREWDSVLAVNLRAPFCAIKLAAERLSATGGSVVNVSSVHAVATSPNVAPYAASKAGLEGLTRAAALELAPRSIRVNAVVPGAVETRALRRGLERMEAGDGERSLLERTPLRRIGAPAEIAEAIAFLLDGERSGFMTGQTLVVDGGALARLSTE
jgi:glucose 1-dehydrogenase